MPLCQTISRLATVSMLCVGALIATTGCTLTRPKAPADPGQQLLMSGGVPGTLQPNPSAEVFQRVKQAKAQNAIVLQVQGDKEPLRVLPLPPEGRSVNVSDLLGQTGLLKRFGNMQVRVHRDAPGQMDGVRMDVKVNNEKVRPESDYALRPGDRIMVRKDDTTRIGKFFGELVPSNAVRAFGG